ncbi:MAG TPA: BtaA family protein [Anaerolineae bacterium]|nr:BtaA family protein [Anaerolineae bacterium]
MLVHTVKRKLVHSTHDLIFKNIHGHRLIYNACWEDPRIDRQLLQLDGASKVVMITSAGCNALDYLLDSPAEIHTVDVNPRQNALLQLKLSLIRRGDFDDLFTMFGRGAHPSFEPLYAELRPDLPDYARDFWDDKIYYFAHTNLRKSFYYCGAAGEVAWLLRHYLRHASKKVRHRLHDLLEAETLEEQRLIYAGLEPSLWNAFARWLIKHPVFMAMVGVPRPQIQLIKTLYPNGLVGYVRDKMRRVFTEMPLSDNYFWRVYLTGAYTEACCPNYLKPEHFTRLQANLDRVQAYTCSLAAFLTDRPELYSHYLLLDHQDWLAWHNPTALEAEWQLILANSRPGTKILMRSAGPNVDFLPDAVKEALRFRPDLTVPLHHTDRVGTYGSLHLAEVR